MFPSAQMYAQALILKQNYNYYLPMNMFNFVKILHL